MSDSPRLVLRLCSASKPVRYLALGLGFIVAVAIEAGQRVPFGTSTNAFAVTQSVLKIFYPEAFGKERQVVFSAEHPVDSDAWGQFTDVSFTIKRFSSGTSWNVMIDGKTGKWIPPPQNTNFLEGHTRMTPRGDLWQLDFTGELAHSKRNEALAKLVESHPEWSDERAGRALKEAGALYGPADTDEFTRSLHLPDLEKSLGLRIASADDLRRSYGGKTVRIIDFDGWSNPDHEGSFTGFDWVVRMQADLPGGRARNYAFAFEPFEGKLIGIFQFPHD
jgi:hypothetical protein